MWLRKGFFRRKQPTLIWKKHQPRLSLPSSLAYITGTPTLWESSTSAVKWDISTSSKKSNNSFATIWRQVIPISTCLYLVFVSLSLCFSCWHGNYCFTMALLWGTSWSELVLSYLLWTQKWGVNQFPVVGDQGHGVKGQVVVPILESQTQAENHTPLHYKNCTYNHRWTVWVISHSLYLSLQAVLHLGGGRNNHSNVFYTDPKVILFVIPWLWDEKERLIDNKVIYFLFGAQINKKMSSQAVKVWLGWKPYLWRWTCLPGMGCYWSENQQALGDKGAEDHCTFWVSIVDRQLQIVKELTYKSYHFIYTDSMSAREVVVHSWTPK